MFLHTLRARIFALVAGAICLTTVILMYFVQKETDQAMLQAHEENAKNLVETILLNIENAQKSIIFHQQATLELRKATLKDNVNLAVTIIDGYYRKFKAGELSEALAQQQAVETIRQLRYANDVGYYWINTADLPYPLVLMHPNFPEYEGTRPNGPEFYTVQGSSNHVFQEFVRVSQKSGNGFVSYLWDKPQTEAAAGKQEKISYVQLYTPWNWIIGSGVYTDDIQKDADKRLEAVIEELNATIPRMRIAQTGYVFILNGDLYNIVHPVLAGKYSTDLRNPVTGNIMAEELIEAAHSPSQTLRYLWDKPNDKGSYIYRKIAIMRYFEPLDWYIGATIYYDEIEMPAKILRNTLYVISIILLFFALIISLLILHTIAEPLRKLSQSVKQIEQHGIESASIPITGTSETRQLGTVLSKMIGSLLEAQTALRESEQRLQLAMDAANDGLFDWNINTNHAYFDKRYFTMAGYEVDEYPHRFEQWQNRIHPDDQTRVMTALKAHLAGETAQFQCEFRFLTKDSNWMWILSRGKTVSYDQDGNAARMVGTHTDISDRKISEKALQESEERFRILYATADPTLLVDNSVFIDCNQAALEMLKLDREEQLLDTTLAHHSPELQPDKTNSFEKWNHLVETALSDSKVSLEWVYSIHGESPFWAEIILTPVIFQDRTLLHCIWRDISHRKRAEQELKRSEEDLKITLDAIGDGVIVIDSEELVVRMNPVAEALTGWTGHEAYGRPLPEILDIVDSRTHQRLASPVKDVLKERTTRYLEGNVKLRSRTGNTHLITSSAAPISKGTDDIYGAVLVIRDETEKVHIERQLLQAQKMEAVGTLAGGLAHDFNNVLSGIVGPVSVLEHQMGDNQELSSDSLKSYIRMIRNSAERATNIVRQLLTISHNQELRFTSVDLNDSIKHVLKIAENTFDKSIDITSKYFTKPALINGDPTQVEQVFLNLLINAAHAMTIMRAANASWGGKLHLEITCDKPDMHMPDLNLRSSDQEYWKVSISDTGIGIAPDDLANIFTPFFSTKDKDTGTGLGLSMVYNIVRQHDGVIIPVSEPGKGTTMHVYFPIQNRHSAAHTEKSTAGPLKGDGLILVVDDEPVLREMAEIMLRNCGYTVLTAEDGEQALLLFKEQYHNIDAVILDMAMPRLSGPETYKKMKEIDREVKVLLSSGLIMNERIQSLLDLGVQGFIQKPYELSELAGAIQQLMASD